MTTRIKLPRFPIAVLLMVIGISIAMLFAHARRQNRFAPIIKVAGFDYGLDPLLVKAVIKRESNFKPRAKGSKGEIGLMQVTPTVGREFAEENEIKDFTPDDLFDPGFNVRVGCWYLGKAMRRYRDFSDPVPFALAQYNAGASNVNRWLKKTKDRGNSRQFLSAITYPGTRKYVNAITRRYRRYKFFSL